MSDKFKQLINHFTKLPGIGPRQAARLVLSMIDWSQEELNDFGITLQRLKDGPLFCKQCFNFADNGICSICSSAKRDQSKIAVVEKITDLAAMEKPGIYNGVYHVLGGVINPADGSVPEKLKATELLTRIHDLKSNDTEVEVILATNPNMYGETTALYLEESLKPLGIKITRLARGLSVGSTLEYVDEITLANALKHRR